MPVVTVADVVRHAEDFEAKLAEYYKGVAEQTTRDGVRILADYMSRHRRRISAALDKMPGAAVRRICCAPIRFEPQGADMHCFTGKDLPPDATAGDVLDMAIVFDECLIRLYRQVLNQDVDPEVREIFESLLRMEERSEIELKKMKALDYF